MSGLPSWATGPEVVHLDPRMGRSGLTPCCGLKREELPYKDRVTVDETQVTCEVARRTPIMNPIVDREAALSRRAGEALQRLLTIRAWVAQASPDQIEPEFRNQLLKLIDWGPQ